MSQTYRQTVLYRVYEYRISSNRSRVSNTSRVSNRSRRPDCFCSGSNGKYHRANGIGHRTLVRCVIRDVLQYVLVLDYGIRCSKKRKSHTLKLKLEAGKPVGSNRSRVSNTSRVSNRSRESNAIVLIQAGGFY